MLGEQLLTSLKVFTIGFGTVFIALILLIYVIELINKVINMDAFTKKDKESTVSGAIKETDETKKDLTAIEPTEDEQDVDDEEIIAVITAAVAASLNRSTHDIVVKSIKRIPYRTPAWNQASRSKQIATRL